MFKHVFCFVMILGYFFGPYSSKTYQIIERDFYYRNKCLDYFEDGIKKPDTFWANYKLFVNAEVDLGRIMGKDIKIETPNELYKHAMEIKKQMDELDTLLKEVRQKNEMFK